MTTDTLIRTVVTGLAAGYLSYLLIVSSSSPKIWQRFVSWWSRLIPRWEGKPFNCVLCLSFWLVLLQVIPMYAWRIEILAGYLNPNWCTNCGVYSIWPEFVTLSFEYVSIIFAGAAIAVTTTYVADRLGTVIL